MRKTINSLLEIDGEIVSGKVAENTKITTKKKKSGNKKKSTTDARVEEFLKILKASQSIKEEHHKFDLSIMSLEGKMIKINKQVLTFRERVLTQDNNVSKESVEKLKCKIEKAMKQYVFCCRKHLNKCACFVQQYLLETNDESVKEVLETYLSFIARLLKVISTRGSKEEYDAVIDNLHPEVFEKLKPYLIER